MATTPPQEDPQQIIETDPSVRSSSPSFYSYSLLIGSKLEGDNDSALGDDVSQYTASLTSSIEDFKIENGRRYHAYKDGSYVMPNDDNELDRLDMSHQMFRILLHQKLYLAPLTNTAPRVLDIGTGTGIWAIELGDELPKANIIGIDLSPTQSRWVPPNVKFEVDDCEEPWTFQEPFDFIHTRYLAGSIVDWPKLARQCFENTAPGGWVEFQDFDYIYHSEDGSMTDDLAVSEWYKMLVGACVKIGRDPCPGPKLENHLKNAGFENIGHEIMPVPVGPWPKDKHLKTVGCWNLVQLEAGLEGFTLRLCTHVLGWTAQEVQVFIAKVRKDFRNPKIHMLYKLHVAYGQKPTKAT